MLQVIGLKYLDNYRLWLSFSDGSQGNLDLSTVLEGPMFEPLKDLTFFKTVRIDSELGTISWPNGVDLAPEFLKDNIQ